METSTTVIRVKRRRSESHEPPACLRIPTIDNTAAATANASNTDVSKTNRQAFPGEDLLSHLMHTSTYIAHRSQPPTATATATATVAPTPTVATATASPRQRKKRRSGDDDDDSQRKSVAVFRRMGTYADANVATSSASSRKNNNKSKRKNDWIRVVNAELDAPDLKQKHEEHQEHQEHGQSQHPPRKRVKLALRFMDTKTMSGSEFWSSPGVSTWQTNTTHATVTTTKKKRGAPVLDPVSRIVDSSLRTLHLTSGPSVQPHLHLLQTDSHLSTFSHPQQQQGGGWINFCCTNGAGTILHAAALWNDLEGSHAALNTMGADVTVLDGDGRTAYDVAIMAGSSGVAEQIIRAGGGPTATKQNHRKSNNALHATHMMNDQEAEGRDEDFVYDVYCLASTDHDAEETDKEARGDEEEKKTDMPAGVASLQNETLDQIVRSNTEDGNEATASSSQRDEEIRAEPPSPSRVTKSAAADANASANNDGEESSEGSSAFDTPQTVELTNGIGYWTESGELILETQMDNIASDADMYDDLPDVEEDHDSNDEGYEGNDYPDDFNDYGDEIDEYYYDRGGMNTVTNYNANRTRGYSDLSSGDEEGGGNSARGEYRNHSLPESMKQAALRPDEIVSAGLNHHGYRHDDKDDDDEDFGGGDYRGNFLGVQESDESGNDNMPYAYDEELDDA